MIQLNRESPYFDLDLEIACCLPFRRQFAKNFAMAKSEDIAADLGITEQEVEQAIDRLSKRNIKAFCKNKNGKKQWGLWYTWQTEQYLSENYWIKVNT